MSHKRKYAEEEMPTATDVDWRWYVERLKNISVEEKEYIEECTYALMLPVEIVKEVEYNREQDAQEVRDTGIYGDRRDPFDGMYSDYGYRDYLPAVDKSEENVWTADNGLIKPCEIAGSANIYLPLAVWKQIVAMTENASTEWLGYLDYTVEENVIKVTSMSIPEQQVTSVEVVPLEPQVGKGVIHAHPGGGTPAFSGTDDKTLNPNNEFSIVISRDMLMTAVARVKLPCGARTLVEAGVSVEGTEPDTGFFAENKAKLQDKPQPALAGVNTAFYGKGACGKRF